MKFLVDTNVFLHSINEYIVAVACKCKERNRTINITKTILNELDPGFNEEILFQETYNCVSRCCDSNINLINVIDINCIQEAKKIYKSIREQYYRWMTDTNYLNKLIKDGKLTRDEIKSKAFKNKDVGECELIAVAKAFYGQYVIISDDKGKVYKHPDINLFEIFKKQGLDIYTCDTWLEIIEYKLGEQYNNY